MSTPRPPVTEAEYLAAKKLSEDFWTQYGPPPRQGKINDLGITEEHYDAAIKTRMRYEIADRDNVSSHTLAHFILAHPDCPVVGLGTGQGSNEAGDDDLKGVQHELYGSTPCITLKFGWGPVTE